jgi:hypothetical protein
MSLITKRYAVSSSFIVLQFLVAIQSRKLEAAPRTSTDGQNHWLLLFLQDASQRFTILPLEGAGIGVLL